MYLFERIKLNKIAVILRKFRGAANIVRLLILLILLCCENFIEMMQRCSNKLFMEQLNIEIEAVV